MTLPSDVGCRLPFEDFIDAEAPERGCYPRPEHKTGEPAKRDARAAEG